MILGTEKAITSSLKNISATLNVILIMFKEAVITSLASITCVVGEITFKVAVIISSVAKITFVAAEITFKVAMITSVETKITFVVDGITS